MTKPGQTQSNISQVKTSASKTLTISFNQYLNFYGTQNLFEFKILFISSQVELDSIFSTKITFFLLIHLFTEKQKLFKFDNIKENKIK